MRDKVKEIILEAIVETNQLMPEGKKIERSLEAKLSAPEGKLDSLSLVNFIVCLEEKLEKKLNITLALANGDTMTAGKTPFSDVDNLSQYICELINKSK